MKGHFVREHVRDTLLILPLEVPGELDRRAPIDNVGEPAHVPGGGISLSP